MPSSNPADGTVLLNPAVFPGAATGAVTSGAASSGAPQQLVSHSPSTATNAVAGGGGDAGGGGGSGVKELSKEQKEDNEAMFKAVEKVGGIEKWILVPAAEKVALIAEFLPKKPAPPVATEGAAAAPPAPAAVKAKPKVRSKPSAKPGAKPGARMRSKPGAVMGPPAAAPVVNHHYNTTNNNYMLGDPAFIATMQDHLRSKAQPAPAHQ